MLKELIVHLGSDFSSSITVHVLGESWAGVPFSSYQTCTSYTLYTLSNSASFFDRSLTELSACAHLALLRSLAYHKFTAVMQIISKGARE